VKMASLKITSRASQQWLNSSTIALVQSSSYSTDGSLTSLRKGTGGRSSFNGNVATVFGASGFLGRAVCNKMGKTGTQLFVPYRGDYYDVHPLKMCGDLGQVLYQPFNLKDEDSLRKAMKYSNVVVNLIGREWETKNFTYDDIYVKGPRTIARIAKECGVKKLIHVSALNASEDPEPLMLKEGSGWLSAKWRGEMAVREEFPEAVIFRPSDMYGQEDRFLSHYASFWRRQWRAVPLWHKGEKTFKNPVFVSDVAQGIVNASRDADTDGKVYQAIGPKRYQLGELVDWIYRVMRKDNTWGYFRYDLRYDPIFAAKVELTKYLPGNPIVSLVWDKIERDHVTDNVVSSLPTLEDLGVVLTQMEDQVPWELRPYRSMNYYDGDLREFEKPAPPPVVA